MSHDWWAGLACGVALGAILPLDRWLATHIERARDLWRSVSS